MDNCSHCNQPMEMNEGVQCDGACCGAVHSECYTRDSECPADPSQNVEFDRLG